MPLTKQEYAKLIKMIHDRGKKPDLQGPWVVPVEYVISQLAKFKGFKDVSKTNERSGNSRKEKGIRSKGRGEDRS